MDLTDFLFFLAVLVLLAVILTVYMAPAAAGSGVGLGRFYSDTKKKGNIWIENTNTIRDHDVLTRSSLSLHWTSTFSCPVYFFLFFFMRADVVCFYSFWSFFVVICLLFCIFSSSSFIYFFFLFCLLGALGTLDVFLYLILFRCSDGLLEWCACPKVAEPAHSFRQGM